MINTETTPITASKMMANWAGQFSPYQLNPHGLNPLRDVLKRQIDFEGLQKKQPVQTLHGYHAGQH